MKVTYKSIDKNYFVNSPVKNLTNLRLDCCKSVIKSVTQVKIYIFKVFYRQSNKKRLEDFTGTTPLVASS